MRSKKVLVVDPDEDSRSICATVLRHHGYEVEEAVDGATAVRMAREEPPELILMDVALPVIDGWEATELLKADLDTAGIPVVILTARALDVDRAKSRVAGCDSFLTKPCSPTRVLQEVLRFVPLEPPLQTGST